MLSDVGVVVGCDALELKMCAQNCITLVCVSVNVYSPLRDIISEYSSHKDPKKHKTDEKPCDKQCKRQYASGQGIMVPTTHPGVNCESPVYHVVALFSDAACSEAKIREPMS